MEFLQKLQKYRAFRVESYNAGIAYRSSVLQIDWFGDFMGITLFRKQFKGFNPRFMWGVSYLFLYVYMVLESTYYYRDNAEQALSCVTTFGFSTQAASKIYSFIVRRKHLIDVHEMNLVHFDSWIALNKTIQQSLKPSILLKRTVLTLTMYGYVILALTIGLAPMTYGLITSNKILGFGFGIVHSDSWTAYFMNGFLQANGCYYVGFLTCITDGAFILHLLTATGQIDAILGLLAELNGMMNQADNEKEINQQVTYIINLHQHHQEYMRKLENVLSPYFLISIASLCFNMSISLAAYVMINWYLGLLIFCFASTQIFYMCFLGTYMETYTDRLMLGINAFDWYKLSMVNQKKVGIILMAAQNPISLTAVLQKLNMEAYVKINKTVYSALMLMLSMKE